MGFLKDFYSSKDTTKREKSDQKIFLIHTCNKELIQSISKELVQIHKKMKGKPSEKGQKAIKTPPPRRRRILRLTSHRKDGATATARPGCRAHGGRTRKEGFLGAPGPPSRTAPSGAPVC